MKGHHTVLVVAALVLSAVATTANAQTVVIDSPVLIIEPDYVCVPEFAVPVQIAPLVQVMPMAVVEVPSPYVVVPSYAHSTGRADGHHSLRHNEAQIILHCPEDTIVRINGEPTMSTGMKRIFTSAMPGHSRRLYQIEATIMRPNSQAILVEKQILRDVVLSPGQEKTVVLAATEFWQTGKPIAVTSKVIRSAPMTAVPPKPGSISDSGGTVADGTKAGVTDTNAAEAGTTEADEAEAATTEAGAASSGSENTKGVENP